MLVLSRKEGQAIKIDGNIEVTVISIQGNRVRLGITAPTDISIQRQEIVIQLDDHFDQNSKPVSLSDIVHC